MADIIDDGNETAELFHTIALRERKPEDPRAPTGECLNCGAPVGDNRRWCSAACRDDDPKLTR